MPLIFPYSEQKLKGINNRFDITPSQQDDLSEQAKSPPIETPMDLDPRKLDKHELLTFK